jgi:hypothetical protein
MGHRAALLSLSADLRLVLVARTGPNMGLDPAVHEPPLAVKNPIRAHVPRTRFSGLGFLGVKTHGRRFL